jgi:hypothetical protein
MLRSANQSIAELQAALGAAQQDASQAACAVGRAEKELQACQAEAAQRQRSYRCPLPALSCHSALPSPMPGRLHTMALCRKGGDPPQGA